MGALRSTKKKWKGTRALFPKVSVRFGYWPLVKGSVCLSFSRQVDNFIGLSTRQMPRHQLCLPHSPSSWKTDVCKQTILKTAWQRIVQHLLPFAHLARMPLVRSWPNHRGKRVASQRLGAEFPSPRSSFKSVEPKIQQIWLSSGPCFILRV